MRKSPQVLGLVLLAGLVVLATRTRDVSSVEMLASTRSTLKNLPWFSSIAVDSWSDVAAFPTILIPCSSMDSAAETLRTLYSNVVYTVTAGHEQLGGQFKGLFLPAASDSRISSELAAVDTYSTMFSNSSFSPTPLAHAAAAAASTDSRILVLLMIVLLLTVALLRQFRTNKLLSKQLADQQQQHQQQQRQQEVNLADIRRLQEEIADLQAQVQAAGAAPPVVAAPAEAPNNAVAAVQQIANFAPSHFAMLAMLQPLWQLLASNAGPAILAAIRTRNLAQLQHLLATQAASIAAISSVFGYDQNPTVQSDAMAAKVWTLATFLICLFHMTAEHVDAVRDCVVEGGMLRGARVRKNGERLSSFAASCEYMYGSNNPFVHRALDPIMLRQFGDAHAVNFNVRNPAFLMVGMLLRAEPV